MLADTIQLQTKHKTMKNIQVRKTSVNGIEVIEIHYEGKIFYKTIEEYNELLKIVKEIESTIQN